MTPTIIMKAWTVALIIPVVAADAGDDFSNNLFTDLGPLLALFGEQFAKQFMSESMGWLDHIIFAMAPLGILTAVVAAIRVGGPSWLRVVIGRARENRATVEVELMSSTSHEVCELWNGQGIVRTIGRPEIQQIIYLDHFKDNQETFGLYTVESAEREGYIAAKSYDDPLISKLQRIIQHTRKLKDWIKSIRPGDLESNAVSNAIPTSTASASKTAQHKIAPNISLNLHGGSKIHELYLVAICGIFLQFGMLVFSGFTVYHPSFKQGFPKDSRHVRSYAFPTMATGTILLMAGMIICSVIVEQSTEEKQWGLGTKQPSAEQPSAERSKGLNARILWLQKKHVVGDQSFDSCVIFGKGQRNTLLSSGRSPPEKKWKSWPFVNRLASSGSEALTLVGVIVAISGFILQFEGLRGMNWSASIAQLVCIFLMTFLRALVRRGLIVTPVCKNAHDQHEMDWLALRIAREYKDKPDQTSSPNFWPEDETEFEHQSSGGTDKQCNAGSAKTELSHSPQAMERVNWRIFTANEQNYADCSSLKIGKAQHALKVRQRLGKLTNWVGKSTKPSVAVATSIGVAMDTLWGDKPMQTFFWSLKVQIDNREIEKIEFKVEKINSKWKADATEIDAALSLWSFHAREMEAENKEDRNVETTNTVKGDWLQQDVELKRQVTRILGTNTEDLRRDIGWWIDDGIIRLNDETTTGMNDRGAQIGFAGPIGFFSAEPQIQGLDSQLQSPPGLTVDSEGSLETLLAQHIFSAFMWEVSKSTLSATRIYHKDQTTIGHPDAFTLDDPEALSSLRLENKVLMGVANSIQRAGLGNLQEAYMCIIPPLSHTKQLPIDPVNDFVRQQMRAHEVLGHWEKVVPVYTKLFRICKTFGVQHGGFRKATAIFINIFLSVSNTLRQRNKQQREDDVETLKRLQDGMLQELRPKQELDPQDMQPVQDSLLYLVHHFAKLYKAQNRLDPDAWNILAPDGASNDKNSGNVHTIFQHHEVFSKIMTMSSRGVKYEDRKNVNTRDILGWTPLHYAVVRGDGDVIHELLKLGSDPKPIDLAEWTPLHYAIYTAKDEEVEPIMWSLIRGGADIEMRGRDGIGPLHLAAKKGYIGVTNLLLQAGANIEIQDNSRMTPLHWAAYNGCDKVVKLLLEKGAHLGARDDNGRTTLHLAAITGNIDVINLCDRTKVETNAKARDKRTALHMAAGSGHEVVVRLLIECGADKEAKDNDGRTAMHWAAWWDHEAVVRLLIKCGADKEAKDNDWSTAMYFAASNGHEAVVRLLIECGADKEAKDIDGSTAMHWAASNGHEAVVRLLIECGADKEAKDNYGSTAMHFAASNGHEAVVRLLIECRADKEAKDNDGRTAMHFAASNGYKAVVRLLIECVADKEAKDNDGRTAVHWAARWGHKAVVRLLIECGADKEAKDNDGRTAMQWAARWGHEAVVRLLIECRTDKEAKDNDGWTAMHFAASNSHEAVVRLLIECGADNNNQPPAPPSS